MPLTGTSKAPARKTPIKPNVSLELLQDQLDAEWRPDADDLAVYFHAAARTALHWIAGDPYAVQFPPTYDTRLVRLCAWLRGQQDSDPAALLATRDAQVTALRERTWPAYRDTCTLASHERGTGTGPHSPPEFDWAALDGTWDEDGPADARASRLPVFLSAESEAWHCNVLAVLFLNRAVKMPLCDLDVTPF